MHLLQIVLTSILHMTFIQNYLSQSQAKIISSLLIALELFLRPLLMILIKIKRGN